MLIVALAATALGFALLVVALLTANLLWAWACIVISLVGFGLLAVDILSGRKVEGGQADAQTDDEYERDDER